MIYRRLGETDLEVSAICLGTMTWGEQNSEADAHRQLDYAVERGVNFIDTAEMYPVPPGAKTQGRTEAYIGTWLKRRPQMRERVILATKFNGRSQMTWIRGAPTRTDRANILAAVTASLKRLKTDYIDLYQVHWPDRDTNFFGALSYDHRAEDDAVPIAETLSVLSELVAAGTIRHVGVSNETPWGLMEYARQAERGVGPRPVSIQNAYNLVNRVFEIGLAEIAIREKIGLLAYSPLAMGLLSGKYLNGARPPGARLTMFDRFTRYAKPAGHAATARYCDLAREAGLEPAAMALAFVNSRPFVTSTIIGATTMEQLQADIDSIEMTLPPDLLEDIDRIHQAQPNPCP